MANFQTNIRISGVVVTAVFCLWSGVVVAQDGAGEGQVELQSDLQSTSPTEAPIRERVASPVTKEPAVVVVEAKDWNHYGYILDNNIFSRNRSPRRSDEDLRREAERDKGPVAPSDPASFMRLVGVSQPDDKLVGFFVDTRSGEVNRVEVGMELSGHKIASISLDDVRYADESGAEVVIIVGKMLNGADGGSDSSDALDSAIGGSSRSSSSSASEDDDKAAQLLQKLLKGN